MWDQVRSYSELKSFHGYFLLLVFSLFCIIFKPHCIWKLLIFYYVSRINQGAQLIYNQNIVKQQSTRYYLFERVVWLQLKSWKKEKRKKSKYCNNFNNVMRLVYMYLHTYTCTFICLTIYNKFTCSYNYNFYNNCYHIILLSIQLKNS